MRVPSEAEFLALWEHGLGQHPIDRALLLGGWARPELPSAILCELPLGAVNEALLRLRETWFGSRILAYVDCEHCGQRLELALDAEQLLPAAEHGYAVTELQLAGFRFRLPCSRDLAAVAHESDPDEAALRLLERCSIARPPAAQSELSALLPEVEAGLEALDPAADINLALACEACHHRWIAGFDIGTVLWDEIEARARALLGEVHALARAYGWTEPEILALSPQRRAAYLEMAGA
jgi:hypothetical protein